MMNIVALAMLLSSLGSAMLLSPEPMLKKSPEEVESPLQAVKDAAQGSVLKAEDTLVEGVTKPVDIGLGWFRRKPPTPEDRLAVARERADEAREAFEEASAQLRDAAAGKAVDTGMYVDGKVSQSVKTAKDAAGGAKGWVKEGAHAAYSKASDVKDGTYGAAAAAGQKAGSAIRGTVSKAKEGVEDTYDSAAETLGSAKEKTYDTLENAKENVNDAHDAVVDNVQLAADKSKGTAIDAAEKVKETGELTKEAGQGILGRVKDAACYTAECIRARAQEAGSYLPLVGQGVGYVYNDEKGDAAPSVKEKANNAAETARQTYDGAKDTAEQYYEEGRDWAQGSYGSGRETAREYYDEAGRRYRRARDYYDGPSDYYTGRRGRSTRDTASRYYDAAKEEPEDFYDHGIKDRARYAYRGARDRAGDYYDDERGYIPGRRQESPRDYYGPSKRRTQYRGEDYYERKRFQPNDELGEVVESMGWKRVGKVPKDHVSVSNPKEVVIGDVKYVWPQGKGQPPSDELHDTVLHHMTKSVKGAAHTVGEKLGFAKEKAKDQTYDTLRDRRSWSSRPLYEDEHDIEDDEDSILTRGARNLKEGVRNAGRAYEEQRSKAGEYADEARQELSSFAGAGSVQRGSSSRSWKDVFIRKPVGFFLALLRAFHLFTFSAVYGSAFWVTFVSGMILSKHIPRQQFGYVQSRIFPVYLRILAVGQVVLLLLHSLLHPWFSTESAERMQLLNFAVMIASTLINAYVLEPRATKVMFERLKVEKEEGRGLESTVNELDAKQLKLDQQEKVRSINEQFKTLHGYSSALNLISLGGLTFHLWHLANRLVIEH